MLRSPQQLHVQRPLCILGTFGFFAGPGSPAAPEALGLVLGVTARLFALPPPAPDNMAKAAALGVLETPVASDATEGAAAAFGLGPCALHDAIAPQISNQSENLSAAE